MTPQTTTDDHKRIVRYEDIQLCKLCPVL